jgi:hypothetical protein
MPEVCLDLGEIPYPKILYKHTVSSLWAAAGGRDNGTEDLMTLIMRVPVQRPPRLQENGVTHSEYAFR